MDEYMYDLYLKYVHSVFHLQVSTLSTIGYVYDMMAMIKTIMIGFITDRERVNKYKHLFTITSIACEVLGTKTTEIETVSISLTCRAIQTRPGIARAGTLRHYVPLWYGAV